MQFEKILFGSLGATSYKFKKVALIKIGNLVELRFLCTVLSLNYLCHCVKFRHDFNITWCVCVWVGGGGSKWQEISSMN